MATFQINGPGDSESSFISFGAILDDVEYQFQLQWLDRRKFWVLRVIDARRELVIKGIRVVGNSDMLQPYSDTRLPPGQLIAHDTTGKNQDPGRNDWRERHILLYIQPQAEEPATEVRVTNAVQPE